MPPFLPFVSLVLLCWCAWLAWRTARTAGINGWLRRYTLAMLVNSVGGTLVLLLVSPRATLYKVVYLALLVPVIALIAVQAIAWLWHMTAGERWIVGACAACMGAFCVWALVQRAEAVWWTGIPPEVWLLIIQCPILLAAGLCALASEARLPEEYQRIASLLGTLWFFQGLEKAMSASGFMYMLEKWLPINAVLASAITAVFLFALSREFHLIRHARVLIRQAAQNEAG